MKFDTNKGVESSSRFVWEEPIDFIESTPQQLRLYLRQKAESLLDEFMARHKELGREAILNGYEPSYLQFYVVQSGQSLEIRWGKRSGKKTSENRDITRYVKKGLGHGYSVKTLCKYAQPWDRDLVVEFELRIRPLRELNRLLTQIKVDAKKIKSRFNKLEESFSESAK